MAVKNSVKAIPLTNIESTAVTGTYALATTLPNACFLLKIINNSDEDITVSFDGVNDADFIPTLATALYNAQTNSQPNNFIANFAQGTPVWVKGTTGTGYVYISGLYSPSAG
jgi:hypothetical protein